MSGPFHWETTDYGPTLLCDVPVVDWDYPDEDAEERRPGDPKPCGEEVYVIWLFSVPVIQGDVCNPTDVPKDAVSSSWRMECVNGHVVGISAEDENAERFDASVMA